MTSPTTCSIFSSSLSSFFASSISGLSFRARSSARLFSLLRSGCSTFESVEMALKAISVSSSRVTR